MFQQEEDPNAAPLCDLKKCKLPECFCTERHHDEFVVNPFDGKLSIDQVNSVRFSHLKSRYTFLNATKMTCSLKLRKQRLH